MSAAAAAFTVDRAGLGRPVTGSAGPAPVCAIRPLIRLAPMAGPVIAAPAASAVLVTARQRRRIPGWVVAVIAMLVSLASFIWLVVLTAELLGDILIASICVLTGALHVVIVAARLLGSRHPSRTRY